MQVVDGLKPSSTHTRRGLLASQGVLDVKGFKKLERRLRKLDDAAAGRALTDSTRDGAKVLRDEMRRQAPRSSSPGGSRGRGHAADHIDVEVRQTSRSVASVNIGPPGWGWYLALPEFGARPHTIMPGRSNVLRVGDGFARSVEHPGFSARPWMRPSFDMRKEKAVRTLKASLARRIRDASR